MNGNEQYHCKPSCAVVFVAQHAVLCLYLHEEAVTLLCAVTGEVALEICYKLDWECYGLHFFLIWN